MAERWYTCNRLTRAGQQRHTDRQEGVKRMSELEKQKGRSLAEAIGDLPADQRQFFLGYCSALRDMAEKTDEPDGEASS